MPSVDEILREATARIARGDRTGAVTAYRMAANLAPARAEIFFNLGALLAREGATDDALSAFGTATRLRPEWAEARYAAARVQAAAGRLEDAVRGFEAALVADPEHLQARVNLAHALTRLKRWEAALPHLRRAAEAAPGDENIWHRLYALLVVLNRQESLRPALAKHAPFARPSGRNLVARLALANREGDPGGEALALAALLQHEFGVDEVRPLAEAISALQYYDVAPAAFLRLYQEHDRLTRERLARRGMQPLSAPVPRERRGDPRLRIGYLSADWRAHVMGDVLLSILAAHDSERFDVHGYSLLPRPAEDAMTARLRELVNFRYVADDNDEAVARTIAADDLDVLIDLMSLTAFGRPQVLARKPARVVLTHLGMHGCVGLSAVDFKVTDRVADLPGNEAFQIEGLLPLDVCVLPLRPWRAPPGRWRREEFGIGADAVVIAAFVALSKLSARCLALWRRVLDAAPSAMLLFSPIAPINDRPALERRLAGHGVPVSRIRFVPFTPNDADANAARYSLADFALDTLPYTGGDTTTAALAAGVPVVTVAGTRHAERMTASILTHAGLPELIAPDDDAFVALGVRMANDAGFRERQRAAVRDALSRPELSDPVRYTRALEAAYERALAIKGLAPI